MTDRLRLSAFQLEDPDELDRFLLHPVVELYIGLRAFGAGSSPTEAVAEQLRIRTQPGDRIWVAGHRARAYPLMLARALPDRRFVATLSTEAFKQGLIDRIHELGLDNLEVRATPADASCEFEPDSCAVITAISALHYLGDPDAFWRQASAALVPDGVVLAIGFRGPDDLEWTASQTEVANRILERLPEEATAHHRVIDRAAFESILRDHPRYCAAASQGRPGAMRAGLNIVGEANAGCSLLRPIALGQTDAWEPTDWAANERLAGILREEADRIADGTLVDDLEMFVAQKPAP